MEQDVFTCICGVRLDKESLYGHVETKHLNEAIASFAQKILDLKSSLAPQLVDGLQPVATAVPELLDATYKHDQLVNATKPLDDVNAVNNHKVSIPLNTTNHLDASRHVNDTNHDTDTQYENSINHQDDPIPVNDVSVPKKFQEEGLNSSNPLNQKESRNINNSSAPSSDAVQVDFIHPPGSRPSLQPVEETPEDLEDGEEDELTILSSPEDEDELDPPISMKTGRFRCPECKYADSSCKLVQDHLENIHPLTSTISRVSRRLIKQEMSIKLNAVHLYNPEQIEILKRGIKRNFEQEFGNPSSSQDEIYLAERSSFTLPDRKRRRHLSNTRPETPSKEVWISNSTKSKLSDPSFISPNQNFNWGETGSKTLETHSSKYSSKLALLPSTRFRSKSPQMRSRNRSKSSYLASRSTRNGSKSPQTSLPSTRYRSKSRKSPSGSTTDNFNSPEICYSTRTKSAISPTSYSNSGKGNLPSVLAPTSLAENVNKSPKVRKRSISIRCSKPDCLINPSKSSNASRNRSSSHKTPFFCIPTSSVSPKTITSVRSSHAEILQSAPKKINIQRTGSSLARDNKEPPLLEDAWLNPHEGSGSYKDVESQSAENLVQVKIHSDTLSISVPVTTSSRTANASSSANISRTVATPEPISPQPHSEPILGDKWSPKMGSINLVPDSGESDLDSSMDSPQGSPRHSSDSITRHRNLQDDDIAGKVASDLSSEWTDEEWMENDDAGEGVQGVQGVHEDKYATELTTEDAVTALVESSNPGLTHEEDVSAPGNSSNPKLTHGEVVSVPGESLNPELTSGEALSVPGESLNNEITPEDALSLENNDKPKELNDRNKVSSPDKNNGCEEDGDVTEKLSEPQLDNAKDEETEDGEKHRIESYLQYVTNVNNMYLKSTLDSTSRTHVRLRNIGINKSDTETQINNQQSGVSAGEESYQLFVSASESVKLARRGTNKVKITKEIKKAGTRSKKPKRNLLEELSKTSKSADSSPVKTKPGRGRPLKKPPTPVAYPKKETSFIEGTSFDELLDAEEDDTDLNPDCELEYTEPDLGSSLLAHLAVRSIGLPPERYDQKEIEAFITTFFPFYRNRFKEWEWRDLSSQLKFNPNIRKTNYVINNLNLAVVNEHSGETRTCLHPLFLERMVQSFLEDGEFSHPSSSNMLEMSSLDQMYLGLARLGYPVSLKQVKYYLLFAIPSFIHEIKNWEAKIQPLLIGSKIVDAKDGLYSISQGYLKYVTDKLETYFKENKEKCLAAISYPNLFSFSQLSFTPPRRYSEEEISAQYSNDVAIENSKSISDDLNVLPTALDASKPKNLEGENNDISKNVVFDQGTTEKRSGQSSELLAEQIIDNKQVFDEDKRMLDEDERVLDEDEKMLDQDEKMLDQDEHMSDKELNLETNSQFNDLKQRNNDKSIPQTTFSTTPSPYISPFKPISLGQGLSIQKVGPAREQQKSSRDPLLLMPGDIIAYVISCNQNINVKSIGVGMKSLIHSISKKEINAIGKTIHPSAGVFVQVGESFLPKPILRIVGECVCKLWIVENKVELLEQGWSRENLEKLVPGLDNSKEFLFHMIQEQAAVFNQGVCEELNPSTIFHDKKLILALAALCTQSKDGTAEYSAVNNFIHLHFPYYKLSGLKFDSGLDPNKRILVDPCFSEYCSTYFQRIVRSQRKLACFFQPEILNLLLPPELTFPVQTVYDKPGLSEDLLVSLAVLQVSDEYGWAESSEIEGFITLHFPFYGHSSDSEMKSFISSLSSSSSGLFNIRFHLGIPGNNFRIRIKPDCLLRVYTRLLEEFEAGDNSERMMRSPEMMKTILNLHPPVWKDYFTLKEPSRGLTVSKHLLGSSANIQESSLSDHGGYRSGSSQPSHNPEVEHSQPTASEEIPESRLQEEEDEPLFKPDLNIHVIIGLSLLITKLIKNEEEAGEEEKEDLILNQFTLCETFTLRSLIKALETVFSYYTLNSNKKEFVLQFRDLGDNQILEYYEKGQGTYCLRKSMCEGVFQEMLLVSLNPGKIVPGLMRPDYLRVITSSRPSLSDSMLVTIALLNLGNSSERCAVSTPSLKAFIGEHFQYRTISLQDVGWGKDSKMWTLLAMLVDHDIFKLEKSYILFKDSVDINLMHRKVEETLRKVEAHGFINLSPQILTIFRRTKLEPPFESPPIPLDYLAALALRNLAVEPGANVEISKMWSFLATVFPHFQTTSPWPEQELYHGVGFEGRNRFHVFKEQDEIYVALPASIAEEVYDEMMGYIERHENSIRECMENGNLLWNIMNGIMPNNI